MMLALNLNELKQNYCIKYKNYMSLLCFSVSGIKLWLVLLIDFLWQNKSSYLVWGNKQNQTRQIFREYFLKQSQSYIKILQTLANKYLHDETDKIQAMKPSAKIGVPKTVLVTNRRAVISAAILFKLITNIKSNISHLINK